jgi:autotransporter adhesin
MPMIKNKHRIALLGICAIIAILAAVLTAPPPAVAQFICVGNATGAAVPPGTADGGGATATGSTANFACGSTAVASGTGSGNSATGTNANAGGNGSNNTATGFAATATGNNSNNTATGFAANGSGNSSSNIATGDTSNASGTNSFNVATGNNANASGNNGGNIATGLNANASGNAGSNIAIGVSANASGSGTRNIAIGFNARATGDGSTAIGNGTVAAFANSAAFGNGAVATRADQQVFGTASNTYTMGGITSAASRAAQSGPTQIVTSDAGGNLATSTLAGLGIASTADISSINAQLAGINSHLNDLDDRVNRVGALGAALAGLHPNPRAKGDNHISAAVGAYRGQPAFAGGYFRNIDNQTLFSAGVSTTGKDWSANSGLTFSW